MGKYGFVILHYGAVDVTERCIESIINLDDSDECVVVVVDNDHNNDNADILVKKYIDNNHLVVIKTGTNIGFSQANNYGYEYIKNNFNTEFIIVANNDIIFDQQNILYLIDKSYTEDEWDVLSPDIISMDNGEHQSPIAFRTRTFAEINYTIFFNRLCLLILPIIYPVLSKKMKTYGHREYVKDKTKDIVPCGACIILSKQFIHSEEAVFSPETKFYYEEYILHHRCKKKGYFILYDPVITVLHGDGKATKNRSIDEKQKLRFMMKNTLESAKIYKEFIKKA